MKTKKQKRNLNSFDEALNLVMALFIFLTALFLFSFFSAIKTNCEIKRVCSEGNYSNARGVEISTNKSAYFKGEKIEVAIKNNENRSIYSEPCEYLNNFEKKIDGEWKEEETVTDNNYYYNQFSFNKNKSVTKCEIDSPKAGEGIYRLAVRIYYNCLKPGREMCGSSKTFYSNEFEVKNLNGGCGCKK